MTSTPDPEQNLQRSWSLGPLRPWLKLLAEQELSPKLRKRVEASDIVQQTLLEAWRAEDQFRGETHAERLAWLRTILTRTIYRAHREHFETQRRGGNELSLQKSINETSLHLEDMAAAKDPSPDDQATLAEQSLLLADALDRLPDEYRQVLVLRQLEGLPHSEVATRMERSTAAVRMLWVRALREMQKVMGDAT